ncbi:MAG: hypothetical protein ACPL3S_04835, partial [Halothiobacillaceae bacterium]
MRLHPLLDDPCAVLVYRGAVNDPPTPEDFRRLAQEALTLMRLELEGEKVVFKPNVTVGERLADPDSGIGTHPAFIWGMVE